jgi:purine nucleoside permease
VWMLFPGNVFLQQSDSGFFLLPRSCAFSVGSRAVFRLCSRMSTRLLACFFLILSAAGVRAAEPPRIPVKVVVISLFEPGADQGDTPGEYQYWVEREHLDHL